MREEDEIVGEFESCEAFEEHLARVLGMAPMEHGSFYVRGNHHDLRLTHTSHHHKGRNDPSSWRYGGRDVVTIEAAGSVGGCSMAISMGGIYGNLQGYGKVTSPDEFAEATREFEALEAKLLRADALYPGCSERYEPELPVLCHFVGWRRYRLTEEAQRQLEEAGFRESYHEVMSLRSRRWYHEASGCVICIPLMPGYETRRWFSSGGNATLSKHKGHTLEGSRAGMALERRFLDAWEYIERAILTGDHLELMTRLGPDLEDENDT